MLKTEKISKEWANRRSVPKICVSSTAKNIRTHEALLSDTCLDNGIPAGHNSADRTKTLCPLHLHKRAKWHAEHEEQCECQEIRSKEVQYRTYP